MRADVVIAVSNSGFTRGAEAKAAQFGIILRDFNTLTQEEIRNWGKQRPVHLTFFEFTNNIITFWLRDLPATPIVIADNLGNPVNWRSLFEPIMRHLDQDPKMSVPGAMAEGDMHFEGPIFISGVKVIKGMLSSHIRKVMRDVSLSSVVAYADPLGDGQSPKALVGSLDLGASEIVEAADTVTVVVDLSSGSNS